MLRLVQRRKATSILLALTLSVILPFQVACDKKKVARESLKLSQDIQLSVNSLTKVLVEAQKLGQITPDIGQRFKEPLDFITNKNEWLNNKAIEWSRSGLPAGAQQSVLDTLTEMLDYISTMDTLAIFHVKNPQSEQAIRAILLAIKTSITTGRLLIGGAN